MGDNSVAASSESDQLVEEKSPDGSKSLSTLDRRQVKILVAIWILTVAEVMILSMIGPILPITARSKGVQDYEIGMLLGARWFAAFMGSLTFGKIVGRVPAKPVILFGCLLMSLCTVALGFLEYAPNREIFLGVAFPLMITEAFAGFRATSVAETAVIVSEMPEQLNSAIAVLQVANAMGYLVAPPIAGALYSVGGFMVPFVVMGVVLLIIVFITMFLLQDLRGFTPEKTGSYFPLIKQPRALLTGLHIVTMIATLRFAETFISLDTNDKFQWLPTDVAWLFSASALTFGITIGLWAFLQNKVGAVLVMLLASLVVIISLSICGPLPFIHIKSRPWQTYVFFSTYASGFAGATITNVPDLALTARACGYPDDYGTQAIVSGVYLATTDIGAFLGPFVGGALYDAFGFRWAILVIVSFYTLLAVLLTIRYIYDRVYPPSLKKYPINSSADILVQEDETSSLYHEGLNYSTANETNSHIELKETYLKNKLDNSKSSDKRHQHESINR